MNTAISKRMLRDFADDFSKQSENKLAMNVVTSNGLCKSARRYESTRLDSRDFSVELQQHGVTAQKQSGRCWMYAGMNFLREKVIEKLNVEHLAFSGAYLMFYDKLEKANSFIEQVIKYIDEPSDSRNVMALMARPAADGGEWGLFKTLVEKYGIVPQDVMPETVGTDGSTRLVPVIPEKLREFARDLRRAYKSGKSIDELREMKDYMMSDIYRMFAILYGEPVKTFDFRIHDKDKNFIVERNITPREFYEKYVNIDLNDYIPLVSGRTGGAELKKYAYVDGSYCSEGSSVDFVTIPTAKMKEYAIKQLQDDEPVWFACDVGEGSSRDLALLDDKLYDYESLLGVDTTMSRYDRFVYGQATDSHAMVLKGVDLDGEKVLLWRVENSWGKDSGNKKGMYSMTDGWFDEYVYEVVINKKHLPQEILDAYKGDAEPLNRWQSLM